MIIFGVFFIENAGCFLKFSFIGSLHQAYFGAFGTLLEVFKLGHLTTGDVIITSCLSLDQSLPLTLEILILFRWDNATACVVYTLSLLCYSLSSQIRISVITIR